MSRIEIILWKKTYIHEKMKHVFLHLPLNVVYIGRNLNLAIIQKVDTAENVCTKNRSRGLPGLAQSKGKDTIESFQFSALMAAS